ncbi:MAG: hypothetical protein AAF546_08355 [Verrucomicrobiota bacterium]
MEPLIDNQPQTMEADFAFRRVDAILRAYGIKHAVVRSAHSQRLLQEAIESRVEGADLQSIASQLVFAELDRGIEMIDRSIQIEPDKTNRNRLLVAINRARIADENPEALLGLRELNTEEARLLAFVYRAQYVPELKRRSMGAPALRFEGINGVTTGTSQIFTRSRLLLQLSRALGIACLFLIIYLFAK